MAKAKKLFTIGYEQTPAKSVLDELERAGVKLLVDVRAVLSDLTVLTRSSWMRCYMNIEQRDDGQRAIPAAMWAALDEASLLEETDAYV